MELAITSPDGKTKTILLEGTRLGLGRSSANELCYPDDVGLSRQHMALERDGHGWAVVDLGSKNGTFVNGVRISARTPLKPGDRIVASRIVLVYAPSESDGAKTVIFEGAAARSSVTVSTTLESLLKLGAQPSAPARGAASQWGTPVAALLRAGRELSLRRPLPELFGVILDLAIEAVSAERGVLLTLERSGRLTVQASRGEGFRISTAVRDKVLNGKTSLLVRDAFQDQALRDRQSIVAQSVRTLMAVPLQTDSDVIGLIYVDSPGFLREFTSDDLNMLTVIANVAAIRIERERLADVEQAERMMAAELEQAADIQRQLLPAVAPAVPEFEFAGYTVACRTVGGDYYDYLRFADGRYGVVIADVAGKGMPAALLMAGLQAKVQAIAEFCAEPAILTARVNRSVASTCPGNRFVTFFFCIVDPKTGEVAYCNAGHNPPLVARGDSHVDKLETGGPVLGIFPALKYEEARTTLQPGDVLLLYSDGVTEATNPAGEDFEPHLGELAVERRGSPAPAIVNAVHEAVRAWTEGQPPADDITVVAVRRV